MTVDGGSESFTVGDGGSAILRASGRPKPEPKMAPVRDSPKIANAMEGFSRGFKNTRSPNW